MQGGTSPSKLSWRRSFSTYSGNGAGGGGNGNGGGNFGEVERVQAQEKQPQKWRGSGLVYTTKKILRKEGWRGLYKGLSVNLIRTVPNSAVTMLT